tara:strand:- start:1395 stop:1802 length:408 start_codon:yes stop_codon:yes gene_type:complete
MIELPDEIYYKIFSYLIKEQCLIFFKGIKLELLDYPIICKTIHYNWKLNFHFQRKTHFWRLKNHTTGVTISADSDDEGRGAMTIYEVKFNNSLKDITLTNMIFNSHFDSYRTPEFITDNFKKSKKVLENIKRKNK